MFILSLAVWERKCQSRELARFHRQRNRETSLAEAAKEAAGRGLTGQGGTVIASPSGHDSGSRREAHAILVDRASGRRRLRPAADLTQLGIVGQVPDQAHVVHLAPPLPATSLRVGLAWNTASAEALRPQHRARSKSAEPTRGRWIAGRHQASERDSRTRRTSTVSHFAPPTTAPMVHVGLTDQSKSSGSAGGPAGITEGVNN